MKQKYYVVLSNGCIGYASRICTCADCRRRGEAEWFINSLNGQYLDCIKHHELFNRNIVLNIGISIDDLTIRHSSGEIARMIADMYMSALLVEGR